MRPAFSRSNQPSAVSRDIAVRTTELSTSIAAKNSSNVASATEPPRGTIASPNKVITIEPVRDGSRFNCSTMRASGCDMGDAYRDLAIPDNVAWRYAGFILRDAAKLTAPQDEVLQRLQ